ncbi:alpha-(1,3)-fucosyltransferase C-like [Mya arenaria]|uniref:alpha-(1,3)-fucosyltransferase C-like n=1 Tax=Mya arenaria TaxID=6604 RepID=UPI0022E5148F|nr:alpha-(1,3)-fucosyltransferase C-like [Mya arenaria]
MFDEKLRTTQCVLFICCAIGISYYAYMVKIFKYTNQVSIAIEEVHVVLNNTNYTHILLWWNKPTWLESFPRKCGNCSLTTDRSFFYESSVVVFSLANGHIGSKPPVENIKRNQNQIWIAFSLETNVANSWNREYRNKHWTNMFNWTWNYRPSADIYMPYGRVSERLKPLSKNYSMIFQRKKKFAAWAVSHCNAHSLRDKFVENMRTCLQNKNIDIFGKCGPLKVSRSKFPTLLNNDYKFYLAFENAFCDDYITEKLFANYNNDIINVVRGKANYTRTLPIRSFINTNDFRNTNDLVHYMIKVSENETLYSSYLIHKDRFQALDDLKEQYKQSICDICRKLNDPYLERKIIVDIEKELGECIKPGDV